MIYMTRSCKLHVTNKCGCQLVLPATSLNVGGIKRKMALANFYIS